MPASKAQQRASNKWISKAYDRINLTVPKGKKAEIKANAELYGVSVNGFINRAIAEMIKSAGSLDTLESAKQAAECTGESVDEFIARAVKTQAKRDKSSVSLGINPSEMKE